MGLLALWGEGVQMTNPAIRMMKVKDQYVKKFCNRCARIMEFRYSRGKLVRGKRIAVYVCLGQCGVVVERKLL